MKAIEYYSTIDACKEMKIDLSNLDISFDYDHAVFKGRIPLELAELICTKYPIDTYGICCNYDERVKNSWKPREDAVDDIYLAQKISEENKAYHKYLFDKRDDKDKFLTYLEFYTKEGLIAFITELLRYYYANCQLGCLANMYNELLALTSSKMIYKFNAQISPYDWIQHNERDRDFYNKMIKRDTDSICGDALRERIEEFDKALMPFIDKKFEIENMEETTQKLRFGCKEYEGRYGFGENCGVLRIEDLKSKSNINYHRTLRDLGGCVATSFSLQLEYYLDDGGYMEVIHYFGLSGTSPDSSEWICIRYFDKDNNEISSVDLDIFNGKVKIGRDVERIANPNEYIYIYNELEKAIQYAKSITIKNMTKEDQTRLALTK